MLPAVPILAGTLLAVFSDETQNLDLKERLERAMLTGDIEGFKASMKNEEFERLLMTVFLQCRDAKTPSEAETYKAIVLFLEPDIARRFLRFRLFQAGSEDEFTKKDVPPDVVIATSVKLKNLWAICEIDDDKLKEMEHMGMDPHFETLFLRSDVFVKKNLFGQFWREASAAIAAVERILDDEMNSNEEEIDAYRLFDDLQTTAQLLQRFAQQGRTAYAKYVTEQKNGGKP